MILKVLAFVLTASLCAAQYGCPRDLSKPCACKGPVWNDAESRYRVLVICDGYYGDVNVFTTVLQKLDNYEIDDLYINNYRNSRLPDQPFTNTIVKRLIISNSPYLESFGSRSDTQISFFTNLGSHLETLIITNSQNIRMEEWERLSDSLALNETAPGEGPALKNLIFFRNGRSSVKNADSFSKLIQLQKITMRNIGLTGSFDSDLTVFPDLRLLDLSENYLTNLTSKLPDQLTTIIIFTNRIEIIGKSFIDDMTNVDYIDIRANPLNCQCDYIQQIVDSQELQGKFGGTCLAPPVMKGRPFGRTCFTSYSWNQVMSDRFNHFDFKWF